jgi:hypothetical protein
MTTTSTYYPDEAKRFAADTEHHTMSVLHDDGLYRHIRFSRPGTSTHWFDLVTWPNHLTITGDMGSFTFARIADMLDFFTGGDINPGYWAEKVQAGKDGIETYNPDRFREYVRQAYDDHVAEDPGADHLPALRNDIKDSVLTVAYDEDEAQRAVRDFRHEHFQFADAWEWDLSGFTYRYLWCCFAIRWGAQQYRAAKAVAA